MQRIMITGPSGAGKSTLARQLGAKLDLPVIHGDHFYFDPGWVQKPREETQALFSAAAEGARWIIDGNRFSTMADRAERADLIIYLDLGRVRRLRRTLWRSLRYFRGTRPDMPEGCPEQFDWAFHLGWVWAYPGQAKMERFMRDWAGKRPVLWLKSPREVRRFLRDVEGMVERGAVHVQRMDRR